MWKENKLSTFFYMPRLAAHKKNTNTKNVIVVKQKPAKEIYCPNHKPYNNYQDLIKLKMEENFGALMFCVWGAYFFSVEASRAHQCTAQE